MFFSNRGENLRIQMIIWWILSPRISLDHEIACLFGSSHPSTASLRLQQLGYEQKDLARLLEADKSCTAMLFETGGRRGGNKQHMGRKAQFEQPYAHNLNFLSCSSRMEANTGWTALDTALDISWKVACITVFLLKVQGVPEAFWNPATAAEILLQQIKGAVCNCEKCF